MTTPSVSIDMFGIDAPAKVKWTKRIREFAEAVATTAAPYYVDHKNAVIYSFRISSEKDAGTTMQFETTYTIPGGSNSLDFVTDITGDILSLRGVTSVISDIHKCSLSISVRIDKTHKSDLAPVKTAKK